MGIGKSVAVVTKRYDAILEHDGRLEHCHTIINAVLYRNTAGAAFNLAGIRPAGPAGIIPGGDTIRVTGIIYIRRCGTDGAVHIIPQLRRIEVLAGLEFRHFRVDKGIVGVMIVELIFFICPALSLIMETKLCGAFRNAEVLKGITVKVLSTVKLVGPLIICQFIVS